MEAGDTQDRRFTRTFSETLESLPARSVRRDQQRVAARAAAARAHREALVPVAQRAQRGRLDHAAAPQDPHGHVRDLREPEAQAADPPARRLTARSLSTGATLR